MPVATAAVAKYDPRKNMILYYTSQWVRMHGEKNITGFEGCTKYLLLVKKCTAITKNNR